MHRPSSRGPGIVLLLLSLFICTPAPAATLLAIVSERNAAEMSQAAQAFHTSHPEHRLVFRTSAQIDGIPDASLAALGDPATRS